MKQQIKNEEEEVLPDVLVVEQYAFGHGTGLLLCRPDRGLDSDV